MRPPPHWLSGHGLPVVLAALVACSSPVGPGEHRVFHRVVGFIDPGGLSIDPLVVPDIARVGVPFTVTVSTFGSSCLRADGADVSAAGLAAEITPYDLAPSEPPPCLPDWAAFTRAVTVTLPAPGDGVVRLRGRGFDGEITLEETIAVLP